MNKLALILVVAGLLLIAGGKGFVPSPTPQPGPTPQPVPAEKRGSVVLLVIETDPSDDEYTAAAINIRNSDKYFSSYAARGLQYRPYDQHSANLGPKIKERLSAFKVPVLAILDDAGDVVWMGVCPLTVEEFDAKVKEVTGK